MISIKIQCRCGQRYAFDVEPVNGRMPSSVSCPACGTNGTDAANDVIAQSLATKAEVPPPAGLRLQTEPTTPPPRSYSTASPPPARAAISPMAGQKLKLKWYEHIWLALPVSLLGVGGAIGGACGGAAWAINTRVFKITKNPILRYVWTGLISASAGVTYLVLALFVLSLFHKAGLADSVRAYDWNTVTSQEGNFSALFPGKTEEVTRNQLFLKVHGLACEMRNSAYSVLYIDYPQRLHISPTAQFFEGARNGALGKGGKLLQERPISIEGYEGREIQVEQGSSKAFIIDRYFLAGNRLYQVMVVVPSENQSSTNIPFFLNSFSLLNKM
jgi:hypothetical protein